MTDEELIAKLKGTAPSPKETDDPKFWASLEAGVRERIALPAPRRIGWRMSMAGAGLAAAAALALFLHLRVGHPVVSQPMPGRVAEDALLPDEDPTELVGDLNLDELETVEHHFHGGV